MHTHTHSHTHTHTHTNTYTQIHTCTHTHTLTHINTHMHSHTHTLTHSTSTLCTVVLANLFPQSLVRVVPHRPTCHILRSNHAFNTAHTHTHTRHFAFLAQASCPTCSLEWPYQSWITMPFVPPSPTMPSRWACSRCLRSLIRPSSCTR